MLDAVLDRRRVAVLVEEVGDRPVHQELLVFVERELGVDFPVFARASPALALAEQRKQQFAEQALVDVVAAQGDAVGVDHAEAVVRCSFENAEVQRAAPEIDGQHMLAHRVRVGVEETHGCGNRFRIEPRFRDPRVAIRLTEARQRKLVSMFVAAFEIHRMTDATMIDRADHRR